MYDITIPENSSSNCFDCIFYSFLKYFHFDYEIYNLAYFYTEYYSENAGEIYRGKNSIDFIRNFFGVDITYHRRDDSDHLCEIVRKALNQSPVGISIDPYYCHWSPFYKKAHYTHALLIVDVNWRNKKYICFDVYYNTLGYVEADFDVLDEYCKMYFLFCINGAKKVMPEQIISHIGRTVESFNYDLEAKSERFLMYFKRMDSETLFPSGVETSVPLINLMWIAEDKKHFPIALKYIGNKLQRDVFAPIYDMASLSGQSFTLLKSMLIKYAITGVLRESSLQNTIRQIYSADALTIDKMKDLMRSIKWN